MNATEIKKQLENIKSSQDFSSLCYELTDSWSAQGLGPESIDPVLEFMEENRIDFGMPGPLVHYVENWFSKGYEEKLIRSIRRRPTPHLVWMLNRAINGTEEPAARRRLVAILKEIPANPASDEAVRAEVEFFLKHLGP